MVPFDYKISFESNNAPWLFYHISKLDNIESKVLKAEKNSLIFKSVPSEKISHYLVWELESIHQELIKIDVKIHIVDNPLTEKFRIITGNSSIVSSTINYLKKLKKKLAEEEMQFL